MCGRFFLYKNLFFFCSFLLSATMNIDNPISKLNDLYQKEGAAATRPVYSDFHDKDNGIFTVMVSLKYHGRLIECMGESAANKASAKEAAARAALREIGKAETPQTSSIIACLPPFEKLKLICATAARDAAEQHALAPRICMTYVSNGYEVFIEFADINDPCQIFIPYRRTKAHCARNLDDAINAAAPEALMYVGELVRHSQNKEVVKVWQSLTSVVCPPIPPSIEQFFDGMDNSDSISVGQAKLIFAMLAHKH